MGFKSPNFTQTPNDFFDDLLKTIDELSELKVTLVALRQTFGYHRDEAELSVVFFEKMSGLSRNSVRRGIDLAIKRGTIRQTQEATPRTGAIFEVAIIDGEGQPLTPRGSAVDPGEGQPLTPLKKERNIKESTGDSKNESPIPLSKTADEQFREMHSQSEGMVPQPHTAATASPQIAERQFVREYAPIFATILRRAKPITEDRQAARRAFGKHFDVARMNERLTAYQNGDGGDFRKPDATAFWIVNRLERDLARSMSPAHVSSSGRNLGA